MLKSPANARFFNRGFQRLYLQPLKAHPLAWTIGASILIFFWCSSLRHALFNSTGWDLGIFDQVVYLISQGQPPISSFIHVHILGDHAAWIFYPLALLYKIYPNVHWLFLVQSTALALGALLTWHLARLAGLRERQAIALSVVYLLYPVIFNANLFDFHPEVIAVPALFAAILAARLGQVVWFCLAIIVVLGCKFILALTVATLGLWLLVFEKKHLYGAIAIISGITWFILATKVILPTFNPQQITSLSRYGYLGHSIPGIITNLFLKPGAIFQVILSLDNLKYLVLVFAPVIWGLSLNHLTGLIPAIPTLALNLLADYQPQKDIVAQYSLPLIPFLMVAVIATLADGQGWFQDSRKFTLWSLIFFLGLARWSYFFTKYLPTIDTWQATKDAIALIQTQGGVYTTNEISPHLSHRLLIERTVNTEPQDLTNFEYILLNQRHPGSNSSPEFAATLIEQLQQTPEFRLRYQNDGVLLFQKATH
ncbi:MAG TPA: DUF2079 domain-containing protein [Waterburya sp.]|jgi:uncharacterized membrane protein